jgi:pimeloyl-ACP methyl ester carboxylesterase
MEARLISGDRSAKTMAAYNYAVARAIESLEAGEIVPWHNTLTVPAGGGSYRLKARVALKEKHINPANLRMIPTDRYEIGGSYFQHLDRQPGVGAPLAVVFRHPGKGVKHDLSETTVYGTATATLSFNGTNAELAMHESLRVDEVTIKGRTFPLAADYSTPLALLVHNSKVEKLGLVRLLVPERYAATARITHLQLYDPERIPVLLVHGLDSTPATWTPLINAMRNDPELRKRYQIWVFSYPSGYPYPYTATLLRHEMGRMKHLFPDHKPIVLVGHSMGGMVNRLMITDSGETIWRDYFGKSPAHTRLPGQYRAKLEEALIFRPQPDISRTIFISTPHRGSQIASGSFGRMFSRLIRTPKLIADVRDAAVSVLTVDATALNLERAPSSIDTLAPNNRFVKSVAAIPIVPGSRYHSIIGDRGRANTPNSSDGVVPYWSSHLYGALSEKIVPSGHSAHQNPEGIQETLRILRAHLGSTGGR